ncbi:GEVED domain-containing protein, partial [Tenacibaculum sp.]|nr:GEVED domain-containing protein [Tenacibaculum sp.]
LVNKANTGQWFYLDTDFDYGDNSRYAFNYYMDNSDNTGYVILNGRGKGFTMNPTNYFATSLQQGTQVNASSPFVSTQWGINRAPRFAGKNVPSNGKTIYTGLRFRDRAGRLHYGWVQVRAKADGSGAELLAASFNRKPNEGITVGQVENVHCYAGANMNEKYDNYSGAIGTFNFEQFTQKSDFPSNYTDFKSKIIKVRPGKNSFSIKDDGIKTSGTNIIGMWIDLNGDKDFEDAGEEIHMSNPYSAGTGYASEVTLPNVNGNYALRITMKNETEAANPKPSPCDFFLHGEVEDYTINISNSNPLYPVAKFEMATNISAKGLLKVTDASTREPDSWNWKFEGGVPATFNGKTPPSIYYEKEGSYKISLAVTKGSVSDTIEKILTVKAHATSYCEASRRGTYANRGDVTKVVFGSITNSTAKGGTGYGDYTLQSTNLVEGQTYPIELSTYKYILNTTNDRGTNLIVWIDWNRNNEFSIDEIAYERRSLASDTADMVLSGNITVPKIYSSGKTRMRVIRYYSFGLEDRPICGVISEADIEDYNVNLINTNVIKPVAKFTANATTITKGNSISFTDQSTNEPTSWLWTFTGGTPNSSIVHNPSITYSTPGTYQVILTVTNLGGSNTVTKTNYITVNDTNPNPINYCTSAGTRIQYEWIAGVKIGTFTNTSTASKYLDLTSKNIALSKNVATSATFTPGYSGNEDKEYFKVWIDYNQNGTFDTNELAFDSGAAKANAQTGTITVPANAKSGATRMRISMKYNSAPTSSCGNIGDGSVQDYTVTIGGTIVTPPIAQFTASLTSISVGNSISFTDQSTNTPTSWSWNFTGGTPTTSAVRNPSITYNRAGTYQVILTASNAGGSDSETKTGYITVTNVTIPVNAGSVSTNDNKTTVTTVTGDGIADIITFARTGNSNDLYNYLITDDTGKILTKENVSHNFEGSSVGICRVYGIAYKGSLSVTNKNITDSDLASGTFDVTNNFITIIREAPVTIPDDAGVIYVEMGDVTISSSNVWQPFELEKGDGDKRIYSWHTGGNLKMLYNTNKPLITNGITGNVTFISEGVTVGIVNNYREDIQLNLSSSSFTDWHGKSGYIGFNFKISGTTHYGWIY